MTLNQANSVECLKTRSKINYNEENEYSTNNWSDRTGW